MYAWTRFSYLSPYVRLQKWEEKNNKKTVNNSNEKLQILKQNVKRFKKIHIKEIQCFNCFISKLYVNESIIL